ncbi:dentin matrix acidic phosphoprotein 1-like [Hyla sarda]|uniref:dentin matrix acidic phosphoprotein 1-like n=1 Tax=Hyla sarda TaxID=327740 RepID=UPI0024C2D9D9|nr:dentin matrix acidic phosphoprotein 1-like [Hyla sarda]XP_056412110.1 dentin matrix acidic phosphoprotein 1-like [Hyla sarda]
MEVLQKHNELDCNRCSFHGTDSKSVQLHMGTIHPEFCEEIDTGGLGKLVFYQKSARLFHCHRCFFTSKMFSNVYYHILGQHAAPDKWMDKAKPIIMPKTEQALSQGFERNDSESMISEDEKSEEKFKLKDVKSEENDTLTSWPENVQCQVTQDNSDIEFKSSSNSSIEKESAIFPETKDSSCDPESSSSSDNLSTKKSVQGNVGAEFSDVASSFSKDIPEFSDEDDEPALPGGIPHFSDDETIPQSKDAQESSDEDVLPDHSRGIEDISEDEMPLEEKHVDNISEDESAPAQSKPEDSSDEEDMSAPVKEMMEFSDDEEDNTALSKDDMDFSEEEEEEVIDKRKNVETTNASKIVMDFSEEEEEEVIDKRKNVETTNASKIVMDFSEEEEEEVIDKRKNVETTNASKIVMDFSEEEEEEVIDKRKNVETTNASKIVMDFSEEDEATNVSRNVMEFSEDEETTIATRNIMEFSEEEETPGLSKEIMEFSEDDDDDDDAAPAMSKSIMEFSEEEDCSPQSKNMPKYLEGNSTPTQSKDFEYGEEADISVMKGSSPFSEDECTSKGLPRDFVDKTKSLSSTAHLSGTSQFSEYAGPPSWSKDGLDTSDSGDVSLSAPDALDTPDDKDGFLKDEEILKHIKRLKGKYQCMLCDLKPLKRGPILHHLITKHNVPSPFICKTCGETFVVETHLKTHLSSSHTKGLYKCHRCNFQTDHPRGFKKHQTHCDRCHKDDTIKPVVSLQEGDHKEYGL